MLPGEPLGDLVPFCGTRTPGDVDNLEIHVEGKHSSQAH